MLFLSLPPPLPHSAQYMHRGATEAAYAQEGVLLWAITWSRHRSPW